nr:erythromycin esterase family protein [Marinobacter vulgaris]
MFVRTAYHRPRRGEVKLSTRRCVKPCRRVTNISFIKPGKQLSFFLELGERTPAILRLPRLERAIGVLYLPQSGRQSHYFFCELARQFDAVFHFDRIHALEPLENASQWARETPETYPFGV